MSRKSAFRSPASSAAVRSLSTTASAPVSAPVPGSAVTGTPPPPAQNERAAAHQFVDGLRLQDPFGCRGGDDATPAGGVGGDVPATFAGGRGRDGVGIHLADELRGVPEGRVVGPDEGMGDQRGDPAAGQGVVQGADQQGADHALGLGAEQVQRVGGAQSGVGRALHGEQADLGAVAVGDDDLVIMGEGGDTVVTRSMFASWTTVSGCSPRCSRALPRRAMTMRMAQFSRVATSTALMVCSWFSAWLPGRLVEDDRRG